MGEGMRRPSRRTIIVLQRAVYRALEPHRGGRFGDAFRNLHHGFVILGIATVVLRTVPWLDAAYGLPFAVIYHAALAFFATEYLCRLFAAPAAPWAQNRPWRDRLYWALSSPGLVDLFSTWLIIAAALLGMATASVRLAAIVWLFKLVPYSEGLSLLARVIGNARSALFSVFLSFVIVLLCAGTLAYVFERGIQPDTFGSIPSALWWAVVTLTTTGYGDAVPVTIIGRMLAGCVMVAGVALLGLWAGILANGFAAELQRRDLLRTWDLVTRVPFFANVGAETIADVTRLLRPREIMEGSVIVRRGEPGDCMYFVVSGEVEIRIPPKPLRLGAGDFFGEIALITGEPRTATAVAARDAVLLVLHLTDFRHLLARRPELMRAINEEAARRLAANKATAQA
jgi:voltage-gated potassium channel